MAEIARLILASASPRRQDLLELLGLDFEVVPSDICEDVTEDDDPERLVSRLSLAKAEAISMRYPEAWVLAADTIVVLSTNEGRGFLILNKPEGRHEAEQMLGQIQGREHRVFTGFAICNRQRSYEVIRVTQSLVRLKPMSEAEIAAYVQTGEPMDKAGSYAAQGIGAMFIEAVNGSYTNVVGLPLAEVREELQRAGIWRPEHLLKSK